MLTPFERNGGTRWTTEAEETQFLSNISEASSRLRLRTIGTSVLNKPIRMAEFGVAPTLDSRVYLHVSGQHGNEPATREATIAVIRDLAETRDPELIEYLNQASILLIPTANPDRMLNRRTNENNVDLNRDWVDRTQPETRAIYDVMTSCTPDIVIDAHEGGGSFNENINAAPSDRGFIHPRLGDLAESLFQNIRDEALSMRRSFARWTRGTDPTMLLNAAAVNYAAGMITETYQNSGNDINRPPSQSRAFDLRVEDNVMFIYEAIKHHKRYAAAYKKAQDAAKGISKSSTPSARPESIGIEYVVGTAEGSFKVDSIKT